MSIPIAERTFAAGLDRVAAALESLPPTLRPSLDSSRLRLQELRYRSALAAGDKTSALNASHRWERRAKAEIQAAKGKR